EKRAVPRRTAKAGSPNACRGGRSRYLAQPAGVTRRVSTFEEDRRRCRENPDGWHRSPSWRRWRSSLAHVRARRQPPARPPPPRPPPPPPAPPTAAPPAPPTAAPTAAPSASASTAPSASASSAPSASASTAPSASGGGFIPNAYPQTAVDCKNPPKGYTG